MHHWAACPNLRYWLHIMCMQGQKECSLHCDVNLRINPIAVQWQQCVSHVEWGEMVEAMVLYHLDLFSMTLWLWHIWWIQHLSMHLWWPWHKQIFCRLPIWFGELIGDCGQKFEWPEAAIRQGEQKLLSAKQKVSLGAKFCPNWQAWSNMLLVGASVTGDINLLWHVTTK